jgi:hypothetical protein
LRASNQLRIHPNLGRVHGNLRWRQSENQPSIANIYTGELEDIAQKLTVILRVGAVNESNAHR